ncbi:MAG: acyl-CoA desaturase [Bacteroidota bacterium]
MKLKGSVKFAKGQNEFHLTLKKRVDQYFKDNNISKHANTQMVIKSICMITGFILPFIFVLTIPMSWGMVMLMYVLMGIATAGIGMSVMHDANHGAYSSNKNINKFVALSLNLVGGMSHNWKLQHNILHHTYTNIADLDEDIDPKGGLRFSPHHHHHKRHRFQYLYAFIIYGLSTFYWIMAKDFVQFFHYTRNGVNPNSKRKNRIFFTKMVINKAIYLAVIVGLPVFLVGLPFWYVALCFFVMHFVGGFILSVIFQMAHSVENAEHPLPDATGTMENNWAIHQMKTTANFARHNKVLSWYVGGLNYQVEHHLFPKICHVHYPALSPLVKQTAEEYGVPYNDNRTFWIALGSHIRSLKKMGVADMDEILG